MIFGYYLITDYIKDYDNVILLDKEVDELIFDFEYFKGEYPNKEDLLKRLNTNDTLIVYELGHIAETLMKFFKLIDDLILKSITLISIKENIDSDNAVLDQEYILQLMIELDSNTRSKKTIIGLNNTRRQGIKGGRKSGLSEEKLKIAKEVARQWQLNPDINSVMKVTGVPKNTVYRYTTMMGVRKAKKNNK